jgi:NADPH:quinone reductase
MTTRKNRQFLLVSRPTGMPTDENFELRETDVPAIEDGQFLVRALYISVDPYMRGRMSESESYIEPFKLGEVLSGGVVAEVVESKHPKYAAGEIVTGNFGWQDYSVSDGTQVSKVPPGVPPTATLGAAGMTGLTAYFGLLDIGQPKEGETVVVSGAAGAVGTVVGQIAKIKGCRVVGIAGGKDKCDFLVNELGFDAAIDYKNTDNLRAALKDACPNGVDVYFDNVGGAITDAVMSLINFQARIAICGQITQYNLEKPELGPRVFVNLLTKSALAKGFIVNDYAARFKEGFVNLGQWLMEGKIKYRENIVEGLENTPQAFLGLFKGENTGKQLVKVADPGQL